jgi:hypothetical protein
MLPSLREFTCVACGKVFHTKDVYRRHVSAHESGQKYACGLCEYSSCYSSNVVSHMRRVHGRTDNTRALVQDVQAVPEIANFAVTAVICS